METILTPQNVAPQIEGLIAFVGIGKLKAAVASWKNSVKNSAPSVRQYYVEQSFGWWRALDEYWDAKRHQRGPIHTASGHVLALAKDAHKFLDLRPTMPESVRSKFRGGLAAEDAPALNFELAMAHHYQKSGGTIQWFEDDSNPMPEFIVATPSISFEVECKKLSVDQGRRIARRDFCQLVDMLEKPIRHLRLMGRIDIELVARLSRCHTDQKSLCNDILSAVKSGAGGGTATTDFFLGKCLVKHGARK